MIRSRLLNFALLVVGLIFVVYSGVLIGIGALRHELDNAAVLHCLIVGGLGLWMAVGTARNLKMKRDVLPPATVWDRFAGALLGALAGFGGATWIVWYLKAPMIVVYVLWAGFLVSFFGMILLIGAYAVQKSTHR